jgi:tRNA threonylcarbamoyladenosine biosynthesis protein TsaB
MAILAIDTSGDGCGTALVSSDGALLAQQVAPMRRGHAEALMPQIETLLAQAGRRMGDLKAIGVVRGPGSFTGLRVGLAAAQGLALGLGIPAIGVDGFAAVRAGLPALDGQTLVLALESRREDPFVQIELASGAVLLPAQPLLPAALQAHLPDGPIVLAGTAVELLHAHLDGRVVRVCAGGVDILAVARLAAQLWQTGTPWPAATPLYLRAPDVTLASPR